MPFVALSNEQRAIWSLCREFARDEIRPVAPAADEADTGPPPFEIWRKASQVGLTSYMVPEEFGGAGLTDATTQCLIHEELAWGCAAIGNMIRSAGFFVTPLLALGDDGQKERWVTPLVGVDPPLTAIATTEP